MLAGISLQLLIGSDNPEPAPANLIRALTSVQVMNRDDGPDAFMLAFSIGRSGPAERYEYPLLKNPLLKPYTRVIIIANLGVTPFVLIDGVITNMQFTPSGEPGQSTLTIIGEDISLLMNITAKPIRHPNQSDKDIVQKIIDSNYSKYGFVSDIRTPENMATYPENDIVSSQQYTDREYIAMLASKYNFVFYMEPMSTPGRVTAYWGPPDISSVTQKSLTVNMGSYTNVTQPIHFQYNPLLPVLFTGSIQDRTTNERIPIATTKGSFPALLAKTPAWESDKFEQNVNRRQFRTIGAFTAQQARNLAQAQTDKSMEVLTASGELDTIRYGAILRARKRVDLRGVGSEHDGSYYVKSVTHTIRRGEYKQNFELKREGTGTKIETVQMSG
jgi:hypothetical protein